MMRTSIADRIGAALLVAGVVFLISIVLSGTKAIDPTIPGFAALIGMVMLLLGGKG